MFKIIKLISDEGIINIITTSLQDKKETLTFSILLFDDTVLYSAHSNPLHSMKKKNHPPDGFLVETIFHGVRSFAMACLVVGWSSIEECPSLLTDKGSQAEGRKSLARYITFLSQDCHKVSKGKL